MLLIATLFSLLHFAFSCTDLTFTLTDSYGDGWNGAYLTVTDNDSSVQLQLDGRSISTTLCVSGTVTIDFVGGIYDNECGYIMSYNVGGDVVDVLTVHEGTAGPPYPVAHTLVYDNGDNRYKLCPAGKYASNGSCESCPAGKYSTAGASCTVCIAGTFQPEEGQTSSAACKGCPTGKSSTEGQANCYDKIPKMLLDFNEDTIAKYGPIEYWDTSLVEDMSQLFDGAAAFNGDISKWDVRNVQQMDYMFQGAAAFNSDISKWQPRHWLDIDDRLFWGHGMHSMFKDSGFKRPLCGGWWGIMEVDSSGDGGAFYRCCDGESCRMCEAGEYASTGSCTACPAGKFSRPESLDSSACFALSSVLSKTQLKAAYSTYSTC